MEGIIKRFYPLRANNSLNTSDIQFLDCRKHYTPHSFNFLNSSHQMYNSDFTINVKDIFSHFGNVNNIKLFLKEDNIQLFTNRYQTTPRRLVDIPDKIHILNDLNRVKYTNFCVGNSSIYTTTLQNNTLIHSFKVVLCIKQEYVYYYKLWLLNGGVDELDYDIFYILVDKSFLLRDCVNNKSLKTFYNKAFVYYSKYYGIDIIEVDNLNSEVLCKIEKTEFKKIK